MYAHYDAGRELRVPHQRRDRAFGETQSPPRRNELSVPQDPCDFSEYVLFTNRWIRPGHRVAPRKNLGGFMACTSLHNTMRDQSTVAAVHDNVSLGNRISAYAVDH